MTFMRALCALVILLILAPCAIAQQTEEVFTGVFTRADHRTYREITFSVPEGATRLSIELEYEHGEPWAAIDMALYDPQRFRGASGFAKTHIEIATFDATPAYLPGPLTPGQWRLVLGGANAPEGRETPFTARVRVETQSHAPAFARVIKSEPGLYRGDFHVHTGHSDGSCATSSGARAPCPVHRTLDAALARGLDFIAVSDHNTVSHLATLGELQPAYDTLAIIPAQEVTTYHGHMNVFGPAAPIDFRLGAPAAPRFEDVAAQVRALGGVLSINHPGISLTDGCPGCGWSAPIADDSELAAIEVVNGVIARWNGGPEGPTTGLAFWKARLNEGARVTAIGGSDNHDPAEDAALLSSIGAPTTVVYAESLSAAAILDGVRAGRVFIDVEGTRDRFLNLSARAGRQRAQMGDALAARSGVQVQFELEVKAAPAGARLEIQLDGAPFEISADDAPLASNETRRVTWRSDGDHHWISANVRNADGTLILISNPVYINAAP